MSWHCLKKKHEKKRVGINKDHWREADNLYCSDCGLIGDYDRNALFLPEGGWITFEPKMKSKKHMMRLIQKWHWTEMNSLTQSKKPV